MFHATTTIRRSVLNAVFGLTLTTAMASAQILDATVVQDPTLGTVTYTIDVGGPPRGAMVIFGSTNLSTAPLMTPYGSWDLDTRSQLSLGVVPMDEQGYGQWEITVPIDLTTNMNLCFQGIAIDPSHTVRCSSWSSAYQSYESKFIGGRGLAGDYCSQCGRYRFVGIGLPKGSKLVVKVNGVPVCLVYAMSNGRAAGRFNHKGLKAGDKISFWVDGKLASTLTH